MFIGIGAAIVAREYPMGTGGRMGPGYFPIVLSSMLAILGLVIMVKGFGKDGPPVDKFAMRPLILILLAVVIFGVIAKWLGLALSLIVLVLISAFGGHEFKLKEVLLAGVVLSAFSIAVFVYGLKLPFPVWPSFLAS